MRDAAGGGTISVQPSSAGTGDAVLLTLVAYIAGGGSEGWMFKQIPAEDKKLVGNTTIRDLMEAAIKKGSVTAPETGRIRQR